MISPSTVSSAVGQGPQNCYYGVYSASVFNTTDPLGKNRVQLQVPQVMGTAISNWADPLPPSLPSATANVGQLVWCMFMGGDINYPVYLQNASSLVPQPSGDKTGVTDTAMIQGAIDRIWKQGGGIVQLPHGVFYVSQIILRNGVIISGSGEAEIFADAQTGIVNGTIIRAPAGSTQHMVIPDPTPSYIASPGLINITFDGNNGSSWLTVFAYTATSASPCVFTATGSSYANGKQIILSGGTPPAPFVNGTIYYVVSAAGASFSLAATSGGTPINSTTTGSGIQTLSVAGNQAPNAFDIINIPTKIVRYKFQNITLINSPGNGINMVTTSSMGGSFMNQVTILNPYANGLIHSGSDMHYQAVEVNQPGQNCYKLGGSLGTWTNCKSNRAGMLGMGVGLEDGWHITGAGHTLAGCVAENDHGYGAADVSSYGFSVSGTKNWIHGTASGAGQALLYLNGGATNNDIDLGVNGQVTIGAPQYIYQIDSGSTANNRVRIKGNPSTGTGYSLLTNGGSEAVNAFELENEAEYASQTIAYTGTINPDPFLGGYVQVGTLTGAITISNPANGHAGSRITFRLTQDGSGGHTVNFGGNYKTAGAIPTTASTSTLITFICDATGGTWHELTRATA